ncbi:hypothetical protein NL676_000880 [Syzygium grande]|nr:hypothetical protein NL676_000880 [Syzygium grande]
MDHAISIDESVAMATPNERLEALKARYVPTPNNQQQVGDGNILKEIVDRLPKLLHVRDENGGTPLHSAVSAGNQSAVELLLEKCPYLALQTDKKGSYPIHIACEGCNVDIIRKLVKMWPDLGEIKNKKGQNILHVAAEGGNNRVVRFILKDCDEAVEKLVTWKDVDGNTPLHLASMHNHCKVLRYLTADKRSRSNLKLLNNDKLNAMEVISTSKSKSTKNPGVG